MREGGGGGAGIAWWGGVFNLIRRQFELFQAMLNQKQKLIYAHIGLEIFCEGNERIRTKVGEDRGKIIVFKNIYLY